MSRPVDVAVVGSGPSGSLAAERLVEAGLQVVLLDVAHDDPDSRALVPDRPFGEIRERDANQRRLFLGDQEQGIRKAVFSAKKRSFRVPRRARPGLAGQGLQRIEKKAAKVVDGGVFVAIMPRSLRTRCASADPQT